MPLAAMEGGLEKGGDASHLQREKLRVLAWTYAGESCQAMGTVWSLTESFRCDPSDHSAGPGADWGQIRGHPETPA